MTQTVELPSTHTPVVDVQPRAQGDPFGIKHDSASELEASSSSDGDRSAASSAAPSTPATRLLVEHAKDTLTFVYKIVDRASGDVISEFPLESAHQLASQPSYTAGSIIDESA